MKTLRCLIVALAGCLALLPSGNAPRLTAADKEEDVIGLSMEVTALLQLHDLKATPAQLEELAKLVKTTAGKMPDRKAPKVSDKVRKLYEELRDALVEDDDEKIDSLNDELDELKNNEKVEIDDDFDLTDEARKKAAEVLRRFTPRQVAGYIGTIADEFPNPLEKLSDALDASRGKTGQEWEDVREETAGQVAWLVAGIDKDGEERVHKKVVALLDRAKKMTNAEFKDRREALEKDAAKIVGDLGPTEVVRNYMLRAVAELLSNPRAAAALEGRLKKAK